MAVNASILVQEEWNQLPEEVKDLVGERGAQGALSLFWDRTATLDSLHQNLAAPRKDPLKDKVRAIVCREYKIELEKLSLAVEKCALAECVWLERNEIRSEGVDELAKALSRKVNLRSLSLKRNYIGDKGAERLGLMMSSWRNKSLETLALGFCNISGKGAQAICTAVLKIPSPLSIGGCAMSLTSLDFTANFLKQEGAKSLAVVVQDLRFLRTLRVGSNGIEDEGGLALAKAAGGSNCLSTLHLESNHLTDTTAKALADALGRNCPLTSLKVSGNSIGAHGAMFFSQAMRSNTCLMQLDLGTNQLGDLGAEHMAGLLRSATLLQELRLSDNGIGEIGGVYIAKAYETNTTLMVLDMDMNAIPPTQQARFQDAVRGRGNVGVLRVANHAYGHLVRPKKEEIVVVVVEARKKTPDGRLLTAKSDGESKRGKTPLDMGNVKLKTVEKKEEKKKLSGPLRDLFRRWNGTEGQQKGSKKSRSMDLKEFLEMVKGMGLLAPGKLTRGKAQDVFRAANRAGGGVGGNDGDSAEMDEDEFEFAMIKLAALLRISLEDLCAAGLAEDAKKTGPGKKVNAAGNVAPEPGASLEEVFLHCAAGAGQSKKRAASMDGKEFVVLLEFLRLMPGKVSKTLAMACFTAGKKKSADSSELDWTAFQFAMKKLAKELDVPYESLHLQEPETPGIVARKKSLQ